MAVTLAFVVGFIVGFVAESFLHEESLIRRGITKLRERIGI